MSNVTYFDHETLYGQRVIGTHNDQIYISGDTTKDIYTKELRILTRRQYSNDALRTLINIPFRFDHRICMTSEGAHGIYTMHNGVVFAIAFGRLEEDDSTTPAALHLFYINTLNGSWDVLRLQSGGEVHVCANCGTELHMISTIGGRAEFSVFNTHVKFAISNFSFAQPKIAFANLVLDLDEPSNSKITSGHLDVNALRLRLDPTGGAEVTIQAAPVHFADGLPTEWLILSPKLRLFVAANGQQTIELTGNKYRADVPIIEKAKAAPSISLHADCIPRDGDARVQLVVHASPFKEKYDRFTVHTIERDLKTEQFRLAPRRISALCAELMVEAGLAYGAVQLVDDTVYTVQKRNLLTATLNVPKLIDLARIAAQKYCLIYSQ